MTKEKIINAFGEGLLYEYLESFFPQRWDIIDINLPQERYERSALVLSNVLVVHFPEITLSSDSHNLTYSSKEYYLLFFIKNGVPNVRILKMHFTPEEYIKAWIHPHVGTTGMNVTTSQCWGSGNNPISKYNDTTQGIIIQMLSYMTTYLVTEHSSGIYSDKGIADMLNLRLALKTNGKYISKIPIHILAKLYNINDRLNLLIPDAKHLIRLFTSEEMNQMNFSSNNNIPSNSYSHYNDVKSITFRNQEVMLQIQKQYEYADDTMNEMLILNYVKENKDYIINKLNFLYEKFRVARKFNLA